MRTWKTLAAATLAAAIPAAALAAQAGPTSWTKVSDGDASQRLGLARTADGVLHVLWAKGTRVAHVPVSATGVPGAATTVVAGWTNVNGPGLVVQPDGTLRAFVPGSRAANLTGPDVGVNTLTAPPSGAPWTLDKQAVWGGSLANQRNVTAVAGKDGVPVTAVGGSGAVFFKGVTRDQPATVLPPQPYSYDPEVAVDAATGAIVGAWYAGSGKTGIVAQQVYPAKGKQKLLGTASAAAEGGISGRLGAPGTFVVVHDGASVKLLKASGGLVWRTPASGVAGVDVTAGPEGRLWVSWIDRSGNVFAARSSKALKAFEAVQKLASPPGANGSFAVQGEGSAGPLDVFADVRAGAGITWFHRQLKPLLTLRTTKAKAPGKKAADVIVTFRVTDAGDPVAGAKVSAAGKTLTTDARGEARLTTSSGGNATATAAGYVSATGSY